MRFVGNESSTKVHHVTCDYAPEKIGEGIALGMIFRVRRDECDAEILIPGHRGIVRRTLAALSGQELERLYGELTPKPSRRYRRLALEAAVEASTKGDPRLCRGGSRSLTYPEVHS